MDNAIRDPWDVPTINPNLKLLTSNINPYPNLNHFTFQLPWGMDVPRIPDSKDDLFMVWNLSDI